MSQRGLGGFPHERLANPEGVIGNWSLVIGHWSLVSQCVGSCSALRIFHAAALRGKYPVQTCRPVVAPAVGEPKKVAQPRTPKGSLAKDEGQMTVSNTGLANYADLYFINSRHKLRFPSTDENLFSSVEARH